MRILSFVVAFVVSFGLAVVPGFCETWQNFLDTGEINALLATGTTIWMGTNGGVVALDEATGNAEHYTTVDGLGASTVIDMAVGPDGRLWVLHERSSISVYEMGRWMSFTPEGSGIPHSPIAYHLVIDGDNVKWITTQHGILSFDDEGWAVYDESNSALETHFFDAAAVDTRNVKWFGTIIFDVGQGVYSFDGANLQHYTAENSALGTNNVTAIGADSKGNVWFSALSGDLRSVEVCSFDGATWTQLEDTPPSYADHIREAPDGCVWFGDTSKIYGWDGSDWLRLDYANSPFGTNVADLCFDGGGTLLVGTKDGML